MGLPAGLSESGFHRNGKYFPRAFRNPAFRYRQSIVKSLIFLLFENLARV